MLSVITQLHTVNFMQIRKKEKDKTLDSVSTNVEDCTEDVSQKLD